MQRTEKDSKTAASTIAASTFTKRDRMAILRGIRTKWHESCHLDSCSNRGSRTRCRLPARIAIIYIASNHTNLVRTDKPQGSHPRRECGSQSPPLGFIGATRHVQEEFVHSEARRSCGFRGQASSLDQTNCKWKRKANAVVRVYGARK